MANIDPSDRGAEEKEKQKKYIKIAVIFVLVIAAINFIHFLLFDRNEESSEEEVIQETEAESTELSEDQDDTSEEEDDDTFHFDADIDYEDVSADEQPDTETASKEVGDLTIIYDPECVTSGSGTIADFSMDIIYFHDGDENNIYAMLFAGYVWENIDDDSEIESLDEAKDAVGEYAVAGSTMSSSWEECDDWYIRKIGYYEDSTSYIYYLLVPKSKEVSDYMYFAGYSMVESTEEGVYSGTMTTEDNFATLQNSLLSLVPDSEFMDISYDDLKEELQTILNDETASGFGVMGGISDLNDANEAYLKREYGVDSADELDDMTEEEKEEAKRNIIY